MKSSGESAGRRSTLASWKPPSTKWRCPSIIPGVTMPAPADSTWVFGPTRLRRSSALSPTAAIVSPATATAPAQGLAESPVHTRP